MKSEEYIQQIENFYQKNLFIPPKSEKNIDILLQPETFYQSIMTQSEESAKVLHKYLNIFLESNLTSKNPSIRQKLSNSYWQFVESVIKQNTALSEIAIKLLLRYGVIISSAISKQIFQIIRENDIYAPPKVSLYYLDEWLEAVSKGDISQSLLDNVKEVSRETLSLNEKQRINQLQKLHDSVLQKAQELSMESKNMLQQILSAATSLESVMKENEYGYIPPIEESIMSDLFSCIQTIQSLRIKNNSLNASHKTIMKYNEDLEGSLNTIYDDEDLYNDDAKNNQKAHSKIMVDELNSIKQMFKMAVGKTGNQLPILFAKFFSASSNNLGTREAVLQILQEIEKIDYTIFFRNIKRTVIRMFPQVLLLPCYGTKGVCWEPFNFFNRNSTSAKIIIPMYSNKLFYCVCHAIGDYRWQINKEEAGHRWTVEGITGMYYQWSENNKVKGSLKENFIYDYIQWIQWESKGISKLHKDIRTMFWRHIPFPDKTKKELKARSGTFRNLV